MEQTTAALSGDRVSRDALDIRAADADVAEFVVAHLRKLANGFAVTAPSAELLRDDLDRGHLPLLPVVASELANYTEDTRLFPCITR